MTHAVLSPSSAERWLQCPSSLAFQYAPRPDKTQRDRAINQAAGFGGFIHTLGAYCLQSFIDTGLPVSKDELLSCKSLWKDRPHQIDVDWAARTAVDYSTFVQQYITPGCDIGIEVSVSLEDYLPGCHGTADVIVHNPDEGWIIVGDLKTGKLAVSVRKNPQLGLYMIGALSKLGWPELEMHSLIYQCGQMPEWYQWTAKELKTLLTRAKKSVRLFDEGPDTHFSPSQAACRFCPHRRECGPRRQFEKARKMARKTVPTFGITGARRVA